jgi:hypothetical protein
VGANFAPQPCIRLHPCEVRPTKQPCASVASSEAAGPFSTRRPSHAGTRVATTSNRHLVFPLQAHPVPKLYTCESSSLLGDHAATDSPVVTRRHLAISSLRARATIMMVLRAPFGPSVRTRYDRASALPFWNRRNRQVSWIRPRRTRALPDFANPFSRRLEPLSSSEPVSPA